jgi:hypothetical protein
VRLPLIVPVTLLFLATACGSRTLHEDTGDASGTTDSDGGDPELVMLCETGCVRYETCASDHFSGVHADQQACLDNCISLFAEPTDCRAAATPYAECTAAMACADWADLLADPAGSVCAAEWSVVGPACGLG